MCICLSYWNNLRCLQYWIQLCRQTWEVKKIISNCCRNWCWVISLPQIYMKDPLELCKCGNQDPLYRRSDSSSFEISPLYSGFGWSSSCMTMDVWAIKQLQKSIKYYCWVHIEVYLLVMWVLELKDLIHVLHYFLTDGNSFSITHSVPL